MLEPDFDTRRMLARERQDALARDGRTLSTARPRRDREPDPALAALHVHPAPAAPPPPSPRRAVRLTAVRAGDHPDREGLRLRALSSWRVRRVWRSLAAAATIVTGWSAAISAAPVSQRRRADEPPWLCYDRRRERRLNRPSRRADRRRADDRKQSGSRLGLDGILRRRSGHERSPSRAFDQAVR